MWSHDAPCDHDHPFYTSANLCRPNSCGRPRSQRAAGQPQVDRWIDQTHTHFSLHCAAFSVPTKIHTQAFAHALSQMPRSAAGNCQWVQGRLCRRAANQRTVLGMSSCPRSCCCQGWGFISVHFVMSSKRRYTHAARLEQNTTWSFSSNRLLNGFVQWAA